MPIGSSAGRSETRATRSATLSSVRAEQRAARDEEAVVGAAQHAQDVRDDQADEADDAGERRGDGDDRDVDRRAPTHFSRATLTPR